MNDARERGIRGRIGKIIYRQKKEEL